MSTNFNFGYTGTSTNFNFTEHSAETDYDFNFGGRVSVYKILRGYNNKFNSIWADNNSSLKNNCIYIGRKEDLTIVKTKNSQVFIDDYYSKTSAGGTNEKLKSDDVVDINVVS